MHSVSYDLSIEIEGKTAPEKPVTILMRSVDAEFYYFADGNIYREESITFQNEKTIDEIMEQYKDRTVKSIVTITVSHKSTEEMAEQYGFSDYQKDQLNSMIDLEFEPFWREVIFGLTGADDDIVNVALSQLGNSGGWPYWAYCGFDSRVEWCACFVSWCAGQCGYVDTGKMIVTGSPPAQAEFFQSEGHWMDGSMVPSLGMIIFFDWYNADFADHVGIVEKVEDGLIYTIEGNADDSVMQLTWVVGDGLILGFGWIVE